MPVFGSRRKITVVNSTGNVICKILRCLRFSGIDKAPYILYNNGEYEVHDCYVNLSMKEVKEQCIWIE